MEPDGTPIVPVEEEKVEEVLTPEVIADMPNA